MIEPQPARFSSASPQDLAFALTVGFELEPGCRERFLALVRANAAASVREEPGCFRFDVLLPEPGGSPDVLLYEIYASRAAFQFHLASAHFLAFDEATRSMVRRKFVSEYALEEHSRAR